MVLEIFSQQFNYVPPFSFILVNIVLICYHRNMGGLKQKIFQAFLIFSFLSALSSIQAADFKTAWEKTVVVIHIFLLTNAREMVMENLVV